MGGAAVVRRGLAQQPSRASGFGAARLAWYEIDFNWYGISLLKKLGLARQIYAVDLAAKAPVSEMASAEVAEDLVSV